jgi:hypothetical protein
MASTYLTSNIGSPSQQRFTWSFWVKRSKLGVEQHMVGNNVDGNNRTHVFFTNTEKLYFYSRLSGTNVITYQTNRLFRDLNAWYHIVCAVDTTQAGGNRIRIYVNGEEETSFATETECDQNTNLSISGTHYIGTYGGDAGSATYSFDGSMSHLHFVDGSQLTPSSFGSTDSTTGEWKINTAPSVTYGSSGYFILKDGNSVTDQSGNSNNFTVAGGTLTKTEDNPSNVFATLNGLTSWRGQNRTPSQVLNKGNLSTGIGSSEMALLTSTIGVKSGKWYWEAKSDGVSKMFFGICNSRAFGETGAPHDHSDQATSTGIYYYEAIPDFRYNASSTSTTGIASISSGDVLGFAMDCDNSVFWIHKNGVYMNSGVPTSGDTGTGAINRMFNYAGSLFYTNGVKDEMFASCYVSSSSGSGTASFNFGNGYFGTTAVSSAGTNASGLGIFEYDVPTGFTALSTKGLNL